jgi:hypothetical protein
MANETMTLIATSTVTSGGSSVSITFSGIPATYTDLLVAGSIKSTTTNSSFYVHNAYVLYNNDSSSYTRRQLNGDGSVAVTFSGSDRIIGFVPTSDSGGSNTFGSLQLYVPNYAASTSKSYIVDTVTENNATAARQTITAGVWANSSAITSLKIECDGGFATGSTMSIYGILKGSGGATVS